MLAGAYRHRIDSSDSFCRHESNDNQKPSIRRNAHSEGLSDPGAIVPDIVAENVSAIDAVVAATAVPVVVRDGHTVVAAGYTDSTAAVESPAAAVPDLADVAALLFVVAEPGVVALVVAHCVAVVAEFGAAAQPAAVAVADQQSFAVVALLVAVARPASAVVAELGAVAQPASVAVVVQLDVAVVADQQFFAVVAQLDALVAVSDHSASADP